MAVDNNFKTSTDSLIKLTLTISGEVISLLPQLVLNYYYIDDERADKKVIFSRWAIDLLDAELIADAAALGVTVHQIVLNGELIETLVPRSDISNLELDKLTEVDVYVEVAWTDTNGDRQRNVIPKPDGVDEDDHRYDPFVGQMVESVVRTGWL